MAFFAGKQQKVLEDDGTPARRFFWSPWALRDRISGFATDPAETGVGIAMGVGGLFDFYSGRIPRAPVWMREIGMKWLYRFWQEPRRMRRRILTGNFVFLCRVMSRKYLTGVAE